LRAAPEWLTNAHPDGRMPGPAAVDLRPSATQKQLPAPPAVRISSD